MTPPTGPDWLTLAFWTKDSASVRDLVLVLGSVIGGALLIWRSLNFDRQVKAAKLQALTAQQGHITDRINKAVENLSATQPIKIDEADKIEPNVAVRLGAIYALGRIAQDSERDHIPIMEILCAYIRANAPSTTVIEDVHIEQHVNKILFDRRVLLESDEESPTVEHWRKIARQEDIYHHVGPPLAPRADIQAALNVLARRSRERIAHERSQRQRGDEDDPGFCLDLRWTNLQGANLYRARFSRAKLSNAYLDGADLDSAELESAALSQTSLRKATLRNANLSMAYLSMARFEGAHLAIARLDKAYVGQANFQRATLWHASLKQTDCRGATFKDADFKGASMAYASLESTDLTDAERLTLTQVEAAFGNIETKLPGYWTTADFEHWPQTKTDGEEFDRLYREWLHRLGKDW